MKKKWQLFETDKYKINELSEKFNISKLLATILINRNIDESDIPVFLNPTRNDFHDPFKMPDMEIAVDRIIKAINNNEKTIIYGDYDVDGITSITVLKKFLNDRGLQVDTYIPNRLEEGYGLNINAVKKIADQGYTLMITVDCGITCIDEIDYANSLGIETIVTDHHEVGNMLPNAIAVVDSKRSDNKYQFRELAGVGVAFKLCQAIGIKLELEEKEYLKFLDIVCIGTISDIVPLIDENRVITKLGLKLVKQTRNLGLRSLINSIGYKNIDSTCISFGLAPRINACGRLGHADDALKLFLSNDISEINQLTKKLNDYNLLRQAIEKEIYDEAINQIENDKLYEKNAIIVSGKNWHHGIIGIVSSKITDLYFKPSILLCDEGEIEKGSGRSIPGFDLHNALMKCQDKIEKFGGHAMAIGITLKKSNVKEFIDEFEKIADESEIDKIVPIINIDAKIDLSEINIEIIKSLNYLEPFGEGNKKPNFVFKNMKITSIRSLGDGKHLKMTLKSNNTTIDSIGFNLGNLVDEYKIGDKIDVVGNIEVNEFNGNQNLQIVLKDLMHSI